MAGTFRTPSMSLAPKSTFPFHASGILWACVFLLLLVAHPASAAKSKTISEIRFEGNDTTQPATMRREMLVNEGDEVDDDLIERSRQAILDLGLFRSVEVRQETVWDGIKLIVTVKEKWYLLPYPRVSANSDGQNSVGAEIRWNNLWGMNHSLRVIGRSRDAKEEDRGRELGFRMNYNAPFLFESDYSTNLAFGHATIPVRGTQEYEDVLDDAQVLISHPIWVEEDTPASRGWMLGGGLMWSRRGTQGEFAPPPDGTAYALIGQLDYRDVHDHVYSETGETFSIRYEMADRHLGSDYSYSRVTSKARNSIPLGTTPHQTFEFGAEIGFANNGANDHPDFALGGQKGLRGFEKDAFKGDFYYLATVQYVRPVIWDWLRVIAGVEVGNAHREADFIDSDPHVSLNLGVRAKFPRFVNFEFEAGFAVPLDGGGSGRFYGDRSDF